MNVNNFNDINKIILNLEQTSKDLKRFAKEEPSLTEKTDQQREKLEAIEDVSANQKELIYIQLLERVQQLPIQLYQLKNQFESQSLNERVYEKANQVLAALEKDTNEVVKKLSRHVSNYSKDPGMSALIESQISFLSGAISREIKAAQVNLQDALPMSPATSWWPSWLWEKKVEHQFQDNHPIGDVSFDRQNNVINFMKGKKASMTPTEITSHELTKWAPAQFCLDIVRFKKFSLNGTVYVNRHPREMRPAQLVEELEQKFGVEGAKRIMCVCNQSGFLQPLQEGYLLYEKDFMEKYPDKVYGLIQESSIVADVVKSGKKTTISMKILMNFNIGRKEDNSWGRYVAIKREIIVPTKELCSQNFEEKEKPFSQINVKDTFSVVIENDRKKAFALLDKF